MSLPSERLTGSELTREMGGNLSVVAKEEVKRLQEHLLKDIGNEEIVESRRKLVSESKIKTEQEKEEMLKRGNKAM